MVANTRLVVPDILSTKYPIEMECEDTSLLKHFSGNLSDLEV